MIDFFKNGLNDIKNAIPFVSPAITGNICEVNKGIAESRAKPIVGISTITAIAAVILAILAADLLAGTVLAAAVSVIPGGIIVMSIYVIFFITLISTTFSLFKLDEWLTKRAIDKLAIKQFIGERGQVSFDAAGWMIKQPKLVKELIKQPGIDLAKKIHGYQNIFQMALRKGDIEVCDLLWKNMTFGDQKQVFDLSSKNIRGALGSGLSEKERVELNSRIKKFQELATQEEKNACNQFIFGTTAAAEERVLPRLPQEIKALILDLRLECQKSVHPKLDEAVA
jgi:hypothetical protein